jgi:hypothetical protein
MRYFPLLDFQIVILLTFLGLAVLILLYVAFRGSLPAADPESKDMEKETYPEGIEAENRPTPPLLIFVYVAFVVWAAAYVIFIGLKGGPF